MKECDMATKDNQTCSDQQENPKITELSKNSCKREPNTPSSLIQSVKDLNKLEEDTRAFIESSTPFSPSHVNVVSLSEEKIVIEVQLKKSDDDVAQESEPDQSNPDDKGSRSDSDSSKTIKEEKSDMDNSTERSDTATPNGPRSSRRAVSECHDVITPIRGILKMTRNSVRRTVSESHAGDESLDDVFESSPDISTDGEGKAKKSVHFNDRIFMSTFRSNSSILSRKNKTLKRTLRKMKKLSGSESSSDVESHERSSSSTEDLKIINSPPVLTPTPAVQNQGQVNGRKVMVVKPFLQKGTIFTVTPVDDSQLFSDMMTWKEDRDISPPMTITRAGRQDSGYDSEESRGVVFEETSWQQVKAKNRRRKNRKPHTDQLRKESRVEENDIDQQDGKENDGLMKNELQLKLESSNVAENQAAPVPIETFNTHSLSLIRQGNDQLLKVASTSNQSSVETNCSSAQSLRRESIVSQEALSSIPSTATSNITKPSQTISVGAITSSNKLCHSSTLTDLSVHSDSCAEVELVTLIQEQTPLYKLRADPLTSFSGYENHDWFISTPVLDPNEIVDLSPEFISETLSYFILSAERLSQMTKTYNDIGVVTRLLEEKERDLELAARIGQTLLAQNKSLKTKNDELKSELASCNETIEKLSRDYMNSSDRVTQLKHDLNVKSNLLQVYSQDLDECESLQGAGTAEIVIGSPSRSFRSTSSNSFHINWESLHEQVCELQEENKRLRKEANTCITDLESEEKKELQLIHDCTKQLTDANVQLYSLQDEVARRSEDNIRQQEEITNLLTQVVELQKLNRETVSENDALKSALTISHECQEELSAELLDLKEKHLVLLAAFHEIQDELRKKNKHNLWSSPYLPTCDSLAAEIESSLGSEGYDSDFASLPTNRCNKSEKDGSRTHSPESVISAKDAKSKRQSLPNFSHAGQCRSLFTTDKLKIVKSLEGSETLNKWKKLATPHLGVILESNAGVKSKAVRDLNAELLDYVIKSRSEMNKKKLKTDMNSNQVPSNSIILSPPDHVQSSFKLYETSSTFTFTTTSLSRSTESTTVTPSFSSIQLSTGHPVPITSTSSNYSSHVTQSLPLSTRFDVPHSSSSSFERELPISTTATNGLNCSTDPNQSSTGYSWSQSLKSSCMSYLNYMSGKSPNCDESEIEKKEIVEEVGDVGTNEIMKEENVSPLREREQVISPTVDLVNSSLPVIQSSGKGLAAMTALAANDTNSGNQGIVFKSHNLSLDSFINKKIKIPINLVSKPRCLPLLPEEKIMCREQFSGPICASRTLRKGGYV